jgi:hypothetical protein
MARSGRQNSSVDPRKLTALVGQAQHVWGKLAWEAAQLRRAHEGAPFDVDALVFGAINFAVTSASLEDWLWKLAARKLPIAEDRVGFQEAIAKVVPLQPAFRDIANTFKHGAHREEGWKGGTVELVHFPAFSGSSKEFVLMYHSEESAHSQTSLELFSVSASQWADFIRSSGLFPMLETAMRENRQSGSSSPERT